MHVLSTTNHNQNQNHNQKFEFMNLILASWIQNPSNPCWPKRPNPTWYKLQYDIWFLTIITNLSDLCTNEEKLHLYRQHTEIRRHMYLFECLTIAFPTAFIQSSFSWDQEAILEIVSKLTGSAQWSDQIPKAELQNSFTNTIEMQRSARDSTLRRKRRISSGF